MSNRSPTLTEPARFLILHEDPPSLLAIKRGIEGAGALAFGARSAGKAVARMDAGEVFDAVVLPWGLADQGACDLVWRLERAGLRAPFLMTFSRAWQRDDAARALQLGYDAFFGSPVDARELCRELLTLRGGQIAASRLKILEMGGDALLRGGGQLWNHTGDPEWRERMAGLAGRCSTRFARRTDRVRRVLEALDSAAGRTIDAGLAECARRACLGEAVAQIAASHSIGTDLLERLRGAADKLLSAAADVGAVLRKVVERARERDARAAGSPEFQALCASASEVLTEAPVQRFVERLAKMLRLRSGPINALPEERLRAVAAHFIGTPREHDALAQARLEVMGDVLARARDAGTLEPADVATLGTLLSCDDPYAEETAGQLIMAASRDGAPPVAPPADVNRLVEDALASAVEADPAQRGRMRTLSQRLDDIVGSGAPGGEIERRHLEGALEILESTGATYSETALAATTLDAVKGALSSGPGEVPTAELALLEGLGVAAPDQAARMARFLESNQRPLTMSEVAKLAAAARTQAGLLELRGALDEWPPPPARLQPTERATARAHAEQACADLGVPPFGELTLSESRRILDTEPRTTGAAHVALRRIQDDAARRAAVERFIEGDHPVAALHAMLEAATEEEPALGAAVREKLGLPAKGLAHADVVALVRGGNIRGAMVAAFQLPSESPRTVAVLNQVALQAEHQGDTARAAELYERALRLQPNRLNTQLNLARIKIRLARPDEARPLLEHIRSVAPGFGDSDALWDELALAS